MDLTPEQKRIAKRIVRIGKKRGESRKEIKAALETGLVESNLRNLKYGDADSQGWRQERASLYKNPTNVKASVNRFFDETSAVEGQYGRAGDLAAAVQRPAAQYRGRYHERRGDAEAILQSVNQGSPRKLNSAEPKSRFQAPSFESTPGVDNAAQRQSLLQGYLSERGKPDALTNLAYGLQNAQDVAPSTTLLPGQPKQNLKRSAAQPVKGTKGPDRALDWANSKLGFQEAGENTGGLADKLNARFGFGSGAGQPWCAMFTSAAVTRGGAPKSARTASVAEVRRKAEAKEGYRGFVNPARAKAGDLILWGDDHIGMVEGVKDGKIQYVAGNESDGVNKGTASVGDVDVVRPAYSRRRVRRRR